MIVIFPKILPNSVLKRNSLTNVDDGIILVMHKVHARPIRQII